jgi:integrase
LRHLLIWADDIPFLYAPKIRPAFLQHILTARLDGQEGQISPSHVKKIVSVANRFFSWLIVHHREYRTLTEAWIDTLKPPNMTIEPIERNKVTLEEIKAMAKAPVYSLRDRRIRAAAVFLFLSGMRVSAFATLPVVAVDLEARTVKQWPELGVKTKKDKHATTHLLNIPELLAVVKTWDTEIRAVLGDEGYWFTPFSPDTEEIDPTITNVGNHRDARVRKDLKAWLEQVGLPYHSPHDFWHGHGRYSLKRAKDLPALKAVSQNMMHANLSTTDGIYGILSEIDVSEQIAALEQKIDKGEHIENAQIIPLLKQLLEKLE